MDLSGFCAPSLIYLIFGLTQVCLDVYQGYFNMALMKILVTIIFTLLLNAMCLSGMTVLAWMIIAIPFILMSVIISMLLFVFGLNPKTGRVLNTVNGTKYSDISQGQIVDDYERVKEDYDDYEKEDIDAREYQLLYGDDDENGDDIRLTKDQILYLWNRRFIYEEGYHYGTDESGNQILLLNSDSLENVMGDNVNDYKYSSRGNNNNSGRLNIINKEIVFNLGNDNTPRKIIFYDDNRVKLNDESGFYFITGNMVNVNNNIRFIFSNKNIQIGDEADVYDNNQKLDTNMKVVNITNI